jgi:hypothetical protein
MKKKLADKIEEVMDLVDRGELSSVDEVMDEFEGYNINMTLLRSIVDEEFEEGFSDRWEELKEL